MIFCQPAPGDAARIAAVEAQLDAQARAFRKGRTYEQRVKDARSTWKKALAGERRLFDEVRSLLSSMYAGGLAACMYCEGPEASQIDHFRSMTWYPDELFAWVNYIHACSVCNGKKGSKLRLHDANGREIRYSRPRGTVYAPPHSGSPLLINPRTEDPMQFFNLDLGTGMLVASGARGSLSFFRASHTLARLGLNKRTLPEQRSALYQNGYRSSLSAYVKDKRAGARTTPPDLACMSHRLIWEEMKRQRAHPDLQPLFADAPEALTW